MPLPDGLTIATSTSSRAPRYWPLIAVAVVVFSYAAGVALRPYVGECRSHWRDTHHHHHSSWCMQP
jgi:hypothetical protein